MVIVSSLIRQPSHDMGQNSSQLGPSQQGDGEMANQTTSKRRSKKHKSGKSKGKSDEPDEIKERADEEEESARALMQLKQGAFHEPTSSYYDDNIQASAQLLGESSPARPHRDLNSIEPEMKNSDRLHGRARVGKGGKKSKRKRGDAFLSSTDQTNGESALSQILPSTPPRQSPQSPLMQDDAVPGTYTDALDEIQQTEGIASQVLSTHALDEISTDDEIINSYAEEYRNGTTSAEPSQALHDDLFAFSQNQEASPVATSAPLRLYSSRESPKHVYTSSNGKAKDKSRKKRKRVSEPGMDGISAEQPHRHEEGQYASDLDFGAGDPYLENQAFEADLFDALQGFEMPIDPELNNTNLVSPPIDLVSNNGHGEGVIEQGESVPQNVHTTKPRKRRRKENLQYEEGPFYSSRYPNTEREEIEAHVPHQSGVPQRQESVELESSFPGGLTQQTQGNGEENGARNGHSVDSTVRSKNRNGAFGAAELSKLEAFQKNYCRANDTSVREFNDIIQSNIRLNPRANSLYNEIQELFPSSKRQYLQRYCRRRFHNFAARGTWTPDEDEMLKRAVAEKGTSWKIVGEMIERFPEDCRDRWRNYLVNSENRQQDLWTKAEIFNLCEAISECLKLINEDRRRLQVEEYGPYAAELVVDSDQEAADINLINWQAVSDRMGKFGGARSRLQCSHKWGKMKEEDRKKYMKEVKVGSRQSLDAVQNGNGARESTKSGWRTLQAQKRVANMKAGDRYDLLQAILNCGAASEGQIRWKTLGDDTFRSKWSFADRKAAWTMLKEDLPEPAPADYRDKVYILLTPILNQEINERWDPEVDGDINELDEEEEDGQAVENGERRKRKKKKRTRKANSQSKQGNGIKSTVFVHEDEDDDGDTATNAQGDYNRIDPQLTPEKRRGRAANPADDVANEEETERGAHASDVQSPDSLFDGSDVDVPSPARSDISLDLALRVQQLRNA